MSTTPTPSISDSHCDSVALLQCTITHVFLPFPLVASPHTADPTAEDVSLTRSVCDAARAYSEFIDDTLKPQWRSIEQMLSNLETYIRVEPERILDHVVSQLRGMKAGDILAFLNRAQDDVVIFRKLDSCALFELYPLSRDKPNLPSEGSSALSEFYPLYRTSEGSDALFEFDPLILGKPNLKSEGSEYSYPRCAVRIREDVFHESHLLLFLANCLIHGYQVDHDRTDTRISQDFGRIIEVPRITKHMFVSWASWKRSLPWLLIKIAIQTSLDYGGLGHVYYKAFILYLMCFLAKDAINANLSSHILHAISAKILRRLRKLGASAPDWVYDMVLKTSASLREILEARWKEVNVPRSLSLLWNFSQLDLERDTQLSLLGSLKYIQSSLTNLATKSPHSPFSPQHLPRGTLNDFLSSNGTFFEKAYHVNPQVALYDVEQAVERGIDDWVARITDVDQACIQLKTLMDTYLSSSWPVYQNNPDNNSIRLLTVIELWVALDKLVIRAVPMLANHSPEIPTKLLQRALFRRPENLHRLCRICQYLSARHSQFFLGNSIFSDEFTKSTFPVRCSSNSPYLMRHLEEYGHIIPSHVSITVFELRCPPSLHIWRSATAHLLGSFPDFRCTENYEWTSKEFQSTPLIDIPQLQPFLARHWTSPVTGQVYLACLLPADFPHWHIFHNNPPTRYPIGSDDHFVYWHPSSHRLHRYTNVTSHTSNGVLVAQAECTEGLSTSEFIAFGHLRSGGSLQWLNILRELRSRTLNFRHHDVHLLLAQAASQVGPFDPSVMDWLWHQELQESSFCHTFVDELESLLVDVGVHSLDGVMMNTASFLLTRLLASCCYEDVSEKAIRLLRQMRTKMFKWVQDLSYDLMVAPTKTERSKLLRDLAAACRSTFDVGPSIIHKLLYSAEDVAALLSCAILIHANSSVDYKCVPEYSRVLLERDRRLSLTLEGVLKDVILADTSNQGIDLAVCNVWSGYRPGPQRWQSLPHPNSHWLTCETAATGKRYSQVLHVNLLDGMFLVDNEPINVLPHEIREHALYKQIFGDQVFLVIPSDLPGMDLSTLALISDHRVHFARREAADDDFKLLIRAQHRDDGDIFEMIPQGILQTDLPTPFIHGHVHWLNLSTRIIELRPLKKIWEHSSDNWRIDCTTEQYRVYMGHECLVDMHSPTWKVVSDHLKCLDVPENLIITTLPINTSQSSPVRQLSAVLPRYGLSFFMNKDGDLESRDFKNMVYDENQCIGTLFGLENRLVLRSKIQVEGRPVDRCVVIPDGLLSPDKSSRLSRFAENGKYLLQPITFNRYTVNTELGCLTGYTSWRSKLYLAYLHAQTSVDWRPDPLTGRTGIQEALRLLRSAASWSIEEGDTQRHWNENPEFLSSGPFSTIYPQIGFAIAELNYLVRRGRFLRTNQDTLNKSDPLAKPRLDIKAALRSAYLFPFDDTGPNLLVTFKTELPHASCIASRLSSQQARNPFQSWRCMPGQVMLGELLLDRCAPKLPSPSRLRCCGSLEGNRASSNPDTHTLQSLFDSIRVGKNDPPFHDQYMSRLHDSARHVREASRMTCKVTQRPSDEEFRKHYMHCRENYMSGLNTIKKELSPIDDLEHALDQAGQWPPITPTTLFRCLASTSPIKLPDDWKQCLVSLALLLVELQRSRRLLRFSQENSEEELSRELENEGCDGWNAEEYPDWLLIQLQGDFVIRGTQADVALKMIFPPFGENSTMQVNMGEGKSSVILPISAAALADGNQLVRVIIPKALTVQTFQRLVDRLGGLVNRPIYALPFSRALTGSYSQQQFIMLHELLSECVHNNGILVVQPEHVLSLKLTTVEKQIQSSVCDNDSSVYDNDGSVWVDHRDAFLELQRWVQSCSRDILDEVDEVLHPRFQQTYTIGHQQHMEGYPGRWTITQQILRLVRRHALSLSHDLPDAIEYELGTSGSFPRIRILRGSDARQRLISLIVEDVMSGHLPSFNFRDIDRDRRLRAAVRAFISSKDVSWRTANTVEEYARQSTLWDGILLLRGLLACNILLFALAERRWRVDYGLSPMRTMLAVPYRFKDVPAPRADFGHPDITIVLTCLSYYYGGLTEEQLRTSFEILQEQDDPSMEYANWLQDYDPDSVPQSVRDVRNINTKSSEQWDKYLFPLFARNQGAADFYLSKVVFPKEAKDFPWKLAMSSWDLAEIREHPITGFSGTNDYQDLLPTSITQRDLDHQRGTTAKVLSHLLQPENNSYTLISHANGDRRTTFELLKMIVDQTPKIRVLLDVGAQVLDLANYQVAKEWLGLSSDSDGAVYFNEEDELMVLTKDGSCRCLISSPFAQQLGRCIVYLDDAHTRGTDLKFPDGFRAAVTLGPKVTKDRLVQGCMRMRKLGRGHSVMFFAPLEVDGNIRAAVSAKDDYTTPVTTTNVLHWAIHETWTDIQERAPYWAQQAIHHNSKYDAWTHFCNNELTREQLTTAWLQPELKSLANLYAPFQRQNVPSCSSVLEECAEYLEIQQQCIKFGVFRLPEAQMEEEQEREINREIEREREVQQPPLKVTPAMHDIHQEVVSFVMTGVIPPLHVGSVFHPVFATLQQTSAAASEAHLWSPCVLATTDFCKTIKPASYQGKMDQFLRPVQWVLSGRKDRDRVLVILSPFEADGLMPDIRESKFVHLHVYTPRTSKCMKSTDDLMFYTIPPISDSWTPPLDLIDQLNVFAGQLYLRDYDSYLRLRHFLGIDGKDMPKNVGTAIRRNLITPGVLEEIGNAVKDSPLPSVMMLLAIRRGGLPFAETHMGRILQGQTLSEEDFRGLVTPDRNPLIGHPRMPHRITGAPSTPSRTYKRGQNTVDPFDADSGRSQKRLRTGQQ